MGKLSDSDKKYLLSLKPDDIDFNLLVSILGDKAKKENDRIKTLKSKINTYDTFTLNANEYFNKERVTTNVGLFLYNKFIIEPSFTTILGYVNDPIDAKVLKKIEEKLSRALLIDQISQDDYVTYLNKTQWLSLKIHAVLSGSFTMNTLKPHAKVVSAREKLFKENKDKLEKNDLITAIKIESELIKVAQETLKDDPGLDLYKSGARGSFNNNFKNISIMRGPIYDPVKDGFDIVKSNFVEGIDKKDIPAYGNAIVTGSFPKAVGTRVSGYLSKQITAAMQSIVLDAKDSDCGTKGFLKIFLTPELKNDMIYRYIIDGGKLIYLNEDNIKKYIDQEIKLRSPMYCIGDKICNKCAGDMYYKLGLTNVGLTATRVSSTLLNLSMKKFHDATVKTTKVNINKLFI